MKKYLIVLVGVICMSLMSVDTKAQATVVDQDIDVGVFIHCYSEWVFGTVHYHAVFNDNFVKESYMGTVDGQITGDPYHVKVKFSSRIDFGEPKLNYMYTSKWDLVKIGEGKVATVHVIYHYVETPDGIKVVVDQYKAECK
ncbi:hypothetical protein [Marinifilum fragile]|uniref:hypothetical protein n=1 Tax=Marinifilum fragile TaxID=570161 RepID=UPI002AA8C43D|nr:hypothetical protein [Marinifilum fragile]